MQQATSFPRSNEVPAAPISDTQLTSDATPPSGPTVVDGQGNAALPGPATLLHAFKYAATFGFTVWLHWVSFVQPTHAPAEQP